MMLFIHGTFNLMYVFDEYWVSLLLWRVKRISLCFVISVKKKGYTYASWWFIVCHNALANFGETLTIDDVMDKGEATQARDSHVIDESNSSNRRHRHR